MLKVKVTVTVALLVMAAFLPAFTHAQNEPVPAATVPSDAEIRQILVDRIDVQHQSVGIVVGLVGPKGQRVVAYGHPSKADSRPVDGDTVFEIGSVTKVFTSLLLSEMVQQGKVALNDPVAKYLPGTVKVPTRDGKQITLLDLATHTSGLPRMPANLAPKDPKNPYADYSEEQLYEFISSYQLPRDVGLQYEYSNLGGGLLGLALARRAGMDYGDLVWERICDPLAMNSTGTTLTPKMKARLASGYNPAMEPADNWNLGPAFAGAGALRSTANDLLTFLAANLGYTKTSLAPAMAAMLSLRRPTGTPRLQIALAWHVLTADGEEIVWHNGGTGGYRSFIGFDPESRIGVVVLSNAETAAGVDDIGLHVLDAKLPLMKPTTERKEVHVDPKIFDGYVGVYQLTPQFLIRITREGDRLFGQATGQGKFEMFPAGEKDYFLKVVDAQVTFETDQQGRGTALTLHQGGIDQRLQRVEAPAAVQAPKEHKEVHVDPKVFDGYLGSYQLAPSFVLTVTREGSQLFVQATGQAKFEVYPESERDYFLKVIDAQITFETDSQGRTTKLILHQNGMDQPAKRVD